MRTRSEFDILNILASLSYISSLLNFNHHEASTRGVVSLCHNSAATPGYRALSWWWWARWWLPGGCS